MTWLDKTTIIKTYCLLRQAERSLDHRLPVESKDWGELRNYYVGNHGDEVCALAKQLASLVVDNRSFNPTLKRSELAKRFSTRHCLLLRMRLALSPAKDAVMFQDDEIHMMISSLERFINLWMDTSPSNRRAVEVRDDAILCEKIIRSRSANLPELGKCEYIENLGMSPRVRHYSLQEMMPP